MKKIYIIAHTHWDREWYKPCKFFQTKLVYMIDHLLDILEKDPDFHSFMLDGQTILLDDYLEIKPEKRSLLEHYICEGRIVVGPWYIQPDEFAPDAESLIRNLQIGISTATQFGHAMRVGYLPDSFGHSSQLPQILKGVGIDSAVVMRGVDPEQAESTEFLWEGLNGDKVLGIHLIKGYSNAMFLSRDNTLNKIRITKLAQEMESLTKSDHILVMNGIDHTFAQSQTAVLCRENKNFKLGSLDDYIKTIKKELESTQLKTLKNELITPRHHRVHTSIASSRINQKQQNRYLSLLLERVLEPLCVIASLEGITYPSELIKKLWATLIQNQTHDGICGCCTDEVHKEIDTRFTSVRQGAQTLIKGHSRALAGRIYQNNSKDILMMVFNTTMTQAIQWIEASVFISDDFTLLDDQNKEIDYLLLSKDDDDISQKSIFLLYCGTPQPTKKVRIRFPVTFNSILGYKVFTLKRIKQRDDKTNKNISISTKIPDKPSFENNFYKIDIKQNGSLILWDKESNYQYIGLNTYEDTGEGGDSYNHSPLSDHQSATVLSQESENVKITLLEDNPFRKIFSINLILNIPKSLAHSGKSRSKEYIPLPIQTTLTLYYEQRRIDFSVTIENNALSHRIRALFPFGERVDHSWAETHFGVIQRSNNNNKEQSYRENWAENPLPIYSMQRFVGLKGDSKDLFILNRGLTEYEVYQKDHLKKESVLAITLHRGFSFLGKPDLAIRAGRPSGMTIPTPDGEALGIIKREYSLFSGRSLSFPKILSEADRYTSPPLAVQNRVETDIIRKKNPKFFQFFQIDNLTSVLSEQIKEDLPLHKSYLQLGSSKLSVSAIKKSETENSLILRLFNPDTRAITGETLTINFSVLAVSITNLLEENIYNIEKINDSKSTFTLPIVEPYTQITLKITYEPVSFKTGKDKLLAKKIKNKK